MPGMYLRGALIEFKPAFLVPIPNVIVFQYNPESLSSSWSSASVQRTPAGQAESNSMALGSDPSQDFSFTISMDANDTVADNDNASGDLAKVYGILPRLAALETLLFSADPSAAGPSLASASACGSGSTLPGTAAAITGVPRQVPTSNVPAVLFSWGAGRIMPVRVSSLKVTEKLYDQYLIPTHAEAEIGLRVLTDSDIGFLDDGFVKSMLQTAYGAMQVLRQTLAIENSADPLISLIPPF
jgi:hypothetical protein